MIQLLKLIANRYFGSLEDAYFNIKEDEINFKCPICGDSKKDNKKHRFWYNIKKDTFHCFNCGASGNKEQFINIMLENNIINEDDLKNIKINYIKSFLENNKKIKQQKDIIIKPKRLPKGFYLQDFIENNGIKNKIILKKIYAIIKYLKSRGIKKNYFKYFYIPIENYWKNYLLLLFYYKGEELYQANTYNGVGSPKYKMQKNILKKPIAFLELISQIKGKKVYVVEGYYDALILNQLGFNSICVFGLNNMYNHFENFLKQYNIIYIPDNDHTFNKFLNNINSLDIFMKISKYKDINEAYIKEKNFIEWFNKQKLFSKIRYKLFTK